MGTNKELIVESINAQREEKETKETEKEVKGMFKSNSRDGGIKRSRKVFPRHFS